MVGRSSDGTQEILWINLTWWTSGDPCQKANWRRLAGRVFVLTNVTQLWRKKQVVHSTEVVWGQFNRFFQTTSGQCTMCLFLVPVPANGNTALEKCSGNIPDSTCNPIPIGWCQQRNRNQITLMRMNLATVTLTLVHSTEVVWGNLIDSSKLHLGNAQCAYSWYQSWPTATQLLRNFLEIFWIALAMQSQLADVNKRWTALKKQKSNHSYEPRNGHTGACAQHRSSLRAI